MQHSLSGNESVTFVLKNEGLAHKSYKYFLLTGKKKTYPKLFLIGPTCAKCLLSIQESVPIKVFGFGPWFFAYKKSVLNYNEGDVRWSWPPDMHAPPFQVRTPLPKVKLTFSVGLISGEIFGWFVDQDTLSPRPETTILGIAIKILFTQWQWQHLQDPWISSLMVRWPTITM